MVKKIRTWPMVDSIIPGTQFRTAIIIDVLRASTTISTALSHGAAMVIPAVDIEEAFRLRDEEYPEALIGGERHAMKVPGFDLGNSPFEYTEETVKGRTIIISTTNGTRSLNAAADAEKVFIGALTNLSTVIDAVKDEEEIDIICSGTQGIFSMEDAVAAGGIISGIVTDDTELDDFSRFAETVFEAEKSDPGKYAGNAMHAKRLSNRGFACDVELALTVDAVPVLPVARNGRITL